MHVRNRLLEAALAAALGLAVAVPATADEQAAATGGSSLALEEITVTARKVAEKLSDAPLAINAFTAADIEEKGFKTLEDVTRLSPGVQYNQMGGQIPGRITSAIRFRGMNVNSDSPSLQLGALFLDGIYVLGGTQSIPYDDIERIEVVRGPQSATYGRSTFGGAINYITRTPSTTEYSGQVSMLGAQHDETDLSAAFEGPIIDDKLSFRIGGRSYERGGLYTASDGGELGKESSESANLTLFATPMEGLKIKLRGFYGRDSDGPPTGGIVQGVKNNSCNRQPIATEDPAVPIATPNNFICGTVPSLGSAISATGGTNIIDNPTTLRPPLAAAIGFPNILVDYLVTRPNPAAVSVPIIDHLGLERIIRRYSASVTYDFAGGYELSLQGGYNKLQASWIRSFGLTPWGIWWSRDPQDSKDESYEIRLTSPQGQRLTWLIGANYYEQDFIQSGSGGDAVSLCAPKPGFPTRTPGSPCVPANATTFLNANNLLQNTDHIENTGFFGAASFDITETLTASIEGRWQKDKTVTAVLTPTPFQVEAKKFLPRAILRWMPAAETNLYASYSEGVLPTVINTQVVLATPRELSQYQAQLPGATAVVPGDELKMYELGWKQTWAEGRAQTSIAAYYGEWKYQKGRSRATVQEDCGSPTHPANRNAAGNYPAECPNGPNLQPAFNYVNGVATTPFYNFRNVNVPGESTLWGVEAEGAMQITEHWDARATLTWAKSEYDDFVFNFVQAIAGFTQMKGNSNARFPEWSGSAALGYNAPINDEWKWFASADASYFGKAYVDESNLAQCDDYWLGNVRGGVDNGRWRIEGFVKNVADSDAWASCARWSDFDTDPTIGAGFQGVAVQPLNPRQFGVRATVKF